MRRLTVVALLLAVVPILTAVALAGGGGGTTSTALYPDLRAIVPAHLQLVNEHQQETLRFSNGVANTGAGPWSLRPDPPLSQATPTTTAIQEFRDSTAYYKCGEAPKQVTACYNVVAEHPAGTFE